MQVRRGLLGDRTKVACRCDYEFPVSYTQRILLSRPPGKLFSGREQNIRRRAQKARETGQIGQLGRPLAPLDVTDVGRVDAQNVRQGGLSESFGLAVGSDVPAESPAKIV